MNSPSLIRVQFLICLSAGTLVSDAAAQEMDPEFYGYEILEDYVEPESVNASEALTLVQSGAVRGNNAWDLLRHVGRSGDSAFIEPLKELAEAFTEHYATRTYGFNALYALRMLGVPRSYFLEKAFEHEDNLWLSKYAINVLTQSPDEATFAQLQTLRDETTNGQIHSALNHYQYVLYGAKVYAELASADERAQFLIDQSSLAKGLTPSGFESGNPDSGRDPIAIWARLKLREIYQVHPDVIQQAIAAIESDPEDPYAGAERERSF